MAFAYKAFEAGVLMVWKAGVLRLLELHGASPCQLQKRKLSSENDKGMRRRDCLMTLLIRETVLE